MTRTQNAAVIGHPIGHTMSPFIQRRLFELSGIPMEYRVLDVPELSAALPELRALDCFNVTIPHKSAIIPYLDGIDDRARLCGSVNTVKVVEGKLYGFTTDGPGAAVSLKIHSMSLQGELLILGNGGAAKAIAFQAAERPNFHVTLAHRADSYEKAMELAEKLANQHMINAYDNMVKNGQKEIYGESSDEKNKEKVGWQKEQREIVS